MASTCLGTEAEKESQVQNLLLDGAKAALAGSGVAIAAREIASAPSLAFVLVRVLSGLAVGFWLVQILKAHIG